MLKSYHHIIYEALRYTSTDVVFRFLTMMSNQSSRSIYQLITMLLSKHYDLQKSLFGEIVFDDYFHKIKTTPGRMKDDDDTNDAKIYKI